MVSAPDRIPLPTLPAAPTRNGLPLVATIAPLVLAVALWIMTSSAYALLFALLGPVVAVATTIDGRRTARRTRRTSLAVAREELARIEAALPARLASRRRELAAAVPSPASLVLDERADRWNLGVGAVPSGIELSSVDDPPELAAEFSRLRELAGWLPDAPVTVDADPEVVLTGAEPPVRALARSLVLQAVARCAPGTARVTSPPGEGWAGGLPARLQEGPEWRVECGARTVLAIRRASVGRGLELRLGHAGEEPALGDETRGWRPGYLAAVEAAHLARRLAELAAQRGWVPPGAIPEQVALDRLLDEQAVASAAASAAAVGCDAGGAVLVDLEQDGPHALVAGTTGSGKSELLVSWILALAARRPPAELAFLLVDFKGGSSFAPLAALPHVAGIVSDLDETGATRAVESLRAELRRREAQLAQHGVRDLDELAPGTLPRLVIVVDEFAALVALDPELQGVFADLAARGRSLGLHLVLGTQRPAGIVRDAVLANITVRVCLRVLEPAESSAMIGSPDAAALPAQQRGRGMLRDAAGVREVQFALADPGTPARIAERWRWHPVPEARSWLDPLPAELASDAVPAASPALAVGLVDRPELQRRDPLVIDPWHGGALLVVGASGSGRTTALAAAGAASATQGDEVRWVPRSAAELWAALHEASTAERTLVVVDDLDALLADADVEERADLAELICRVARDTRRTGIAVVASARGVGGALQAAAGAFEQRMLLRLPSREEHLLSGGDPRGYRADRRPGSAVWRGHEAQLVHATASATAWRARLPEVRLDDGAWAIVTPRGESWLAHLAAAGVPAARLGSDVAGARVLVGDTESWLIEHRLLAEVRRSGRMLLHGCTRADLRALTRTRIAVSPLEREEAWSVEGAEVARVRVRLGADAAQASPSGASSNSRL